MKTAKIVRSAWVYVEPYGEFRVYGRNCFVWVSERPAYCDRGAYLAHLEVTDPRALSVDGADLWPRYYFDEGRMRAEVEAWMRKRGEWVDAAEAGKEGGS